MSRISIIMPIYNGGKWLDEAITSVINQTFDDFELICVNDGSTDDSEEILKKYSAQDCRVKYYTKDNEGQGVALNYGVLKAQGEYLCFLGQDDKYRNDYLEKMFNLITTTECNVAFCSGCYWEGDKITKFCSSENFTNIIEAKTLKQKKKLETLRVPEWLKIIKREFFLKNDMSFLSIKAPDVSFHLKVLCICDRIGYSNESLYYHRVHSGQVSSNDFDTALIEYESLVFVFDWVKKYIGKKEQFLINKFLKDFILFSSDLSGSVELQDKLYALVKENYTYLEAFVLCNKIKHKRKKLMKN